MRFKIKFAQAVPSLAQIDMDRCIKCELCKGACEVDAIDFDQKDELLEFEVGSIIVATGWDEFEPPTGYLGYIFIMKDMLKAQNKIVLSLI